MCEMEVWRLKHSTCIEGDHSSVERDSQQEGKQNVFITNDFTDRKDLTGVLRQMSPLTRGFHLFRYITCMCIYDTKAEQKLSRDQE